MKHRNFAIKIEEWKVSDHKQQKKRFQFYFYIETKKFRKFSSLKI